MSELAIVVMLKYSVAGTDRVVTSAQVEFKQYTLGTAAAPLMEMQIRDPESATPSHAIADRWATTVMAPVVMFTEYSHRPLAACVTKK